jgi:hypothetical protein
MYTFINRRGNQNYAKLLMFNQYPIIVLCTALFRIINEYYIKRRSHVSRS